MAKLSLSQKIERAVKILELDIEFPHTHHYDMCYSYDGHRSDLACDEVETPTACFRCNGTGKYAYFRSASECPKCRGTGIRGGSLEAQKKILTYLERDEQLDRLIQES